MAKRKKPKVTYKAHEIRAYNITRETVEDGYGGQMQRRTEFLGIVYSIHEANKIVTALTKLSK